MRNVWHHLLESEVIRKNFPTYRITDRPLSELTDSELELLVFKSLQLQKNWTAPNPPCKAENTVITRPDIQRDRVVRIAFLPSGNSRWLITVSSVPSEHLIQCWDTQCPSPKCVGQIGYTTLPRVLVNSDPNHPATLSVTFSR